MPSRLRFGVGVVSEVEGLSTVIACAIAWRRENVAFAMVIRCCSNCLVLACKNDVQNVYRTRTDFPRFCRSQRLHKIQLRSRE